jgi:DNA-binding CsgD family transcriptional regulator
VASKSANGHPQSLIALYDAGCRIVWISETIPPYNHEGVIGKEPWQFAINAEHAERLQAAILRVLLRQTPELLDFASPHVGVWRLRIYYVPLQEVRVAVLARKIPPQLTVLTELELQICRMLANGEHTPDIADAMKVSRSTISAHRAHIARKLTIATDELVSWCGAHREWF